MGGNPEEEHDKCLQMFLKPHINAAQKAAPMSRILQSSF